MMRTYLWNAANQKKIEKELLSRQPSDYPAEEAAVAAILKDIKEKGTKALLAYTVTFDKVSFKEGSLEVSEKEIRKAYREVDKELLHVIRHSIGNIRDYHEMQIRQSWFTAKEDGVLLGQKITPMETAGVYVPGGRAAYPSTVLMNILPAKVAGVKTVIMCTPAMKDGTVPSTTLVAAKEAGADRIFKVGGAQAIGAMAYGSTLIPKADIIVGPGNIYVALAKKAVFGHCAIDSIAGPSEIAVLADESANPEYAAADLLSQAEHDPMASPILVTTSKEFAKKVEARIETMTKKLERKVIIEASLRDHGLILITKTMKDAIDAVNLIAPEHLEILTKDPMSLLGEIKHAGAIFLGPYSSEPLGDYYAGPNHVLPTNGTARFFSPLSVDHFVKKSSVISYSENALKKVHEEIETFAKAEGLTAHARSIAVRFPKRKKR